MATKSKADKSMPADAAQETPVQAPQETTFADAQAEETLAVAFVPETTVAPEPAGEIVNIVSTPLAVIEEAVESATEAFSASFEFDTSAWSKKSFELWAENATAFLDLAERVAKARTFEEVVDLQSRFASERFEAFVRQSKELMDFAKSVATMTAAPLRDARKAA